MAADRGKNFRWWAGPVVATSAKRTTVRGALTRGEVEENVLLPTRRPGDDVVMDNLGAHKTARASLEETVAFARSCVTRVDVAGGFRHAGLQAQPARSALSGIRMRHFARTLSVQGGRVSNLWVGVRQEGIT